MDTRCNASHDVVSQFALDEIADQSVLNSVLPSKNWNLTRERLSDLVRQELVEEHIATRANFSMLCTIATSLHCAPTFR